MRESHSASLTWGVPSFLLNPTAAAAPAGACELSSPAEAERLHAALAVAQDLMSQAAAELADCAARLPQSLRSAEAWFALLSRYPSAEAEATLRRCSAGCDAEDAARLVRFGLLQAGGVAAAMVPALRLAPAVKLLFCEHFRNIARPRPGWADFFRVGHIRFEELVRVVTLRRYPAGQHDWNISRLPLSWLPRFRPRALPRLFAEVMALRGRPPMAVTHLNYMRANPWVVLDAEAQRSYHRIARSIALHPEVQGILTYSWFYCSSVGKVTPHLAWLRDFFADQGAALLELQPAPESSGFTVGSRQRQQLFAAGAFHPRITMVIWRRAALLDWAAANPELAEPDTQLQLPGITDRDNQGAD